MDSLHFSADSLRLRAGDLLFDRGVDYAEDGRVALAAVGPTSARALVAGSEDYTVHLSVATGRLTGSCTCPFAGDHQICKHIVAAGLVWLDSLAPVTVAPEVRPAPGNVDLRGFLLTQDREWLAEQLLVAADMDPVLRARLRVAAGEDPEDSVDAAAVRARLVAALETGEYVSYREAWDYFAGVSDALDGIDALLDVGATGAAAGSALLALDLLEEIADQVDDSDGGLIAARERAEEIHFRAVEAGEVDPRALARDLARRALTSEIDMFYDAIERYGDLLGPEGLEAYRDVVEEKWQELSPHGDRSRWAPVSRQRELITEAIGGTDALVALLREDVSTEDRAVALVRTLLAADRADEAVAEAGALLIEFNSSRLRGIAADAHVRLGRRVEAGELSWENFVAMPGLRTFQSLKERSGPEFFRWRERALDRLWQGASENDRWSPLVDVLLWDGDMPGAWGAAQEHGAGASAWLTLARWRAAAHPAEAADVLVDLATETVGAGQRSAYAEAARLLREAQGYVTDNDAEALGRKIRELRAQNRRRPALQDEFTRAGLPG